MSVDYDDYGELKYDKNNYNIKKMNELAIGDIVMLKECPGKIINYLASKHKIRGTRGLPKVYIECIGLFDDCVRQEIDKCDKIILLPIIQTETLGFVNINDKIIELYNENTNEIIEIIFDNKLDMQIIKMIYNNINNSNDHFNVKVIKFLNWIRVVGLENNPAQN